MKKVVKDRFEELVVVLVLIFVALEVISVGLKLIATGTELFLYTIQVDDYNSNPVKTDQMTEVINKVNMRREALYNSDDLIVRYFSKSYWVIKIFIIGLVVGSYYFIGALFRDIVKTTIKRIRKAKKIRK